MATAGIAASIFVGFRNTNAYQRWWEARTLWGAVVNDSRAMHNGLSAIDTESAAIAPVLDRMRRRQVRHAWRLAASCAGRAAARGRRPHRGPTDATATELLNLQAQDVKQLCAGGHIDNQARVMLMSVSGNLLASQVGWSVSAISPCRFTDMFIRTMAWVFALVAFSLLHVAAHFVGSIALGWCSWFYSFLRNGSATSWSSR